jgi:hypothetical protein
VVVEVDILDYRIYHPARQHQGARQGARNIYLALLNAGKNPKHPTNSYYVRKTK